MATEYEIALGDEIITFEGPDGLTDEQITALADSQLRTAKPGQSFTASVYGGEKIKQPPAQSPDDWENMTYFDRMKAVAGQLGSEAAGFVQGVAETGDSAADLLESGYNQTLGRVFGESNSADTPAFGNAAARLGEGDPMARSAGKLAGDILLTKGMGGMAAGGATAALESEREGLGFLGDVASGMVGGKVADAALKGVGRAISPVVDEAARRLYTAGAKLTPGQSIPALKEFEDKAMSWPFIGPKIIKARQESFEAPNRIVLDEALKPVLGKGLPASIKTGHDAIRYTGDALSKEYEALIPKLGFASDSQLIADVAEIGKKLAGPEFAPSTRRRFEALVRDGVQSRFSGANATGKEYRAADEFIGKQISKYGGSPNPEDRTMAEGFRALQEALSGALQRSNPEHAEKLASLNRGWALLIPAESAASRATGGVFSPGAFRAAVRANNKQVRKRGMARGEALGQQLADDASSVLPSSYPNPAGTAGHTAYNIGDLRLWQGLAASQLYGPRVQNALRTIALSPRPAAAPALAAGVERLPAKQLGGFGAINVLGALLPAN